MSGLLPSIADITPNPDPDPRLIGLESEDAAELLGALSSETARALLAALHEEPATPSALADHVGTSLQNAQYHLEKLEAAELIEPVGTQYSAKGREMTVFAPANGPLVVYPGADDDASLTKLLGKLVGGVAVIGFVSLLVEWMVLQWGASEDTVAMEADSVAFDTRSTATESTHWIIETLTAISPGVAVFLFGLICVLVVGVWYHQRTSIA